MNGARPTPNKIVLYGGGSFSELGVHHTHLSLSVNGTVIRVLTENIVVRYNGPRFHLKAGREFAGTFGELPLFQDQPLDIFWGDGSMSSAVLTEKHHRLQVSGSHPYAMAGHYVVKVYDAGEIANVNPDPTGVRPIPPDITMTRVFFLPVMTAIANVLK